MSERVEYRVPVFTDHHYHYHSLRVYVTVLSYINNNNNDNIPSFTAIQKHTHLYIHT